MATDPLEIPVNLQDNTGPVVQGFSNLAAVTKQIRDDVDAIASAMDGVNERAEKMRSYWKDNLDAIESMKSVLEIVASQTQSNQAAFSNNIMQLQEMLNSVKGLGGNIGNAMAMMGMAGGGNYGQTGAYMGAVYGSDTSSPDWSTHPNVTETAIRTRPRGGAARDFSDLETGGGGRGGGSGRPPAPSVGGYDEDEGRKRFTNRMIESIISPQVENTIPNESLQTRLQQQLRENYPNIADTIISQGKESRSAEIAYNKAISMVTRTAGSAAGSLFKKTLGNLGIDRGTLREAQAQAPLEPLLDESGAQRYYPGTNTPMMTRTSTIPSGGSEEKMLKIADQIVNVFGSKLLTKFTDFAGYASIAGSVYNAAAAVSNAIRPFAQLGQQQGGVVGEVDYGRSAGQALGAFMQSGLNLNPFWNMNDIMQAQINAQALGLKGNNIQQYVNIASQFQQQYGLNAAQTQQILGTGLSVGVGLQNNSDAFAFIRALEDTTQTSSAYGNQAYLSSLTTLAGGGATPAVAAQLAAQSTVGAAGNLIAQSYGDTNTDILGTQLGTALMAQFLNTSYTGVYAAEQGASANTMEQALNATNEEILQWAGINTKKTYKNFKDFNDTNKGQAQILQMVLSNPQVGLAKHAGTPQAAMNWAWQIIQGIQKYKKDGLAVTKGQTKSNKALSHGLLGGTFGRVLGDVTGAIFGTAGGKAVTEGAQSLETAHLNNGRNNAYTMLTKDYGKTSSSVYQAAKKAYEEGHYYQSEEDLSTPGWEYNAQQAANRAIAVPSNRMGSKNKVEVSLAPNATGQIRLAVKSNTAGFNNGTIPTNKQPVTSFTVPL